MEKANKMLTKSLAATCAFTIPQSSFPKDAETSPSFNLELTGRHNVAPIRTRLRRTPTKDCAIEMEPVKCETACSIACHLSSSSSFLPLHWS